MDDLVEYDATQLAALLPWPSADANKYSRGTLTLVAGSAAYPGAACLAAAAAQRMGAGYARVLCAPEAVALVRAWRPSLVVAPWDDYDFAHLPEERSGKPCAVAVGCGFDADADQSDALLQLVLHNAACPVLVDGGALGALARSPLAQAALETRAVDGLATVLTPHGGEAARLAAAFDIPTQDPRGLALQLARAYSAVVLLKGPVSYVSDGLSVVRMGSGTPALAKAGTGDVLAGMVGSLLAQGAAPLEACVLGAHLHACAGVIAAEGLTTICAIPEDVINCIPHAINQVTAMAQA